MNYKNNFYYGIDKIRKVKDSHSAKSVFNQRIESGSMNATIPCVMSL